MDKNIAEKLDYDRIKFPVKKKILARLKERTIFAIVAFRVENAAYESIKAILKEYKYCKKVMKKTLTKI